MDIDKLNSLADEWIEETGQWGHTVTTVVRFIKWIEEREVEKPTSTLSDG